MAPGYRASANYMNAPAPPPTHLHDPTSGTSKVRKDVCQSNSACPPCDGTSVCPRTTSDRQLLTLMLKIFILFRNSARFAGAIFDRIMNHVFVLCIAGLTGGRSRLGILSVTFTVNTCTGSGLKRQASSIRHYAPTPFKSTYGST